MLVSVCVYLTIVVHKKLFTPFNKHITGIEKSCLNQFLLRFKNLRTLQELSMFEMRPFFSFGNTRTKLILLTIQGRETGSKSNTIMPRFKEHF